MKRPIKLAINLGLSLGMLGLCLWLVWPDAKTRTDMGHALHQLSWHEFGPYLMGYLGCMCIVHFGRAWRWNNLLAPIGAKIAAGPLMAISSVGFLAILALPARLGEFVRPALLRQRGVSAAASLGTVAVERIVDGLVVSLLVFGCCFAQRGPDAPHWMMPVAYTALGVFTAATVFLSFALRRPEATVSFCLKISLLPRVAPKIADALGGKLLEMISGFGALHDKRNMLEFMGWSAFYWTANGVSMWLLARGLHLPLSLIGAFATMGLVAVGITLPNSPGLVGQFQYFTLLGLSLYLGPVMQDSNPNHVAALTFAIMHHGLQVAWYVVTGSIALATPWVAFSDLKHPVQDATGDAQPVQVHEG